MTKSNKTPNLFLTILKSEKNHPNVLETVKTWFGDDDDQDRYYQLNDDAVIIIDDKHSLEEMKEKVEYGRFIITFPMEGYFYSYDKEASAAENILRNYIKGIYVSKYGGEPFTYPDKTTNCFLITIKHDPTNFIGKFNTIFNSDYYYKLSDKSFIVYDTTKTCYGLYKLFRNDVDDITILRLGNAYDGHWNINLWEWLHMYFYKRETK